MNTSQMNILPFVVVAMIFSVSIADAQQVQEKKADSLVLSNDKKDVGTGSGGTGTGSGGGVGRDFRATSVDRSTDDVGTGGGNTGGGSGGGTSKLLNELGVAKPMKP